MINNEKPKYAVGYIRVSTAGQVGEDKYGEDAQREAIQGYCAEHGLILTNLYKEQISGVADERPVLDKLLYNDEIMNPPIQCVVVAKSDRLARDMKLYFYYLYLLEKKGVSLKCVSDTFGEDNEFANIYRSLMLFVAEQERKNINLRTKAGRVQKANKGGYSGGKPPYGYVVKDGELTIVPEEAEIIREIFRMLKIRAGVGEILSVLKAEGKKTRTGKDFASQNIYNIRDNEKMYRGYYRYGHMDWTKGTHEPILKD